MPKFYRNSDKGGVEKMVDDATQSAQRSGVIVGASSGGMVRVQLNGSSNTVPATLLRGVKAEDGDRVLLEKSPQTNKWVVLGPYSTDGSSKAASPSNDGTTSLVVAPTDMAAVGGPHFIVTTWTAPASKPGLNFELEVAEDDAGTGSVLYTVSGSIYVLPVPVGTTRFFRARSLGANWARSGWTNWVSATSEVGAGDVTVGPGSSTDHALARFDGVSGILLEDGLVTSDDSGNTTIPASVIPNIYQFATGVELTEASDAITLTRSYHTIKSETGTADNLATISGAPGPIFVVLKAKTGHTITVLTGSGNIVLNGGSSIVLSGDVSILLFWDGTHWSDVYVPLASSIEVKEIGGSPDVPLARELLFPTGSLTDLGGGQVEVTFPVAPSGSLTVTKTELMVEEVLYENTLSIDGVGWDITSIDQTYQDLRLVIRARTASGIYADFEMYMNNDTDTSHYHTVYNINTTNTTPGAWLGYASGSDANDPSRWSVIEVSIPYYTDAAKQKIAYVDTDLDYSGGTIHYAPDINWRDVSAINRLTVQLLSGGYLKAGSSLQLIGRKKLSVVTDALGGFIAAGVKYIYNTNTANTDPGAGHLKFDNATLLSATVLRISETDDDTNGLAAWIATWDDSTATVRGTIMMRKDTDPSVFAILQVTGTNTDAGAWDDVNITPLMSHGSFADADIVRILFFQNGDDGAGSGSVTDVTWVTGDGVSASIANPTTTPAITPALGAITPDSAKAKGTAGTGFFEDVAQSSDPSAPAATGLRLFADASGFLAWIIKNGSDTYKRLINGTLTANRTYTLPDASGNILLDTATQNISNKTITASTLVATALSLLLGGFKAIFTHSNTADRTYTLPNYDATIASIAGTEVLTNKTLTSPVLNTGVSGTAIDTDSTLAANSDTKLASQKAVKSYVDAVANGLSPKASVVVATTVALPTNTYSNGASGVGATLTAVTTGVLTVDGHTMALGERLLVQNESVLANDGLYIVTVAGAIGVAYVLTRTTDANTSSEIIGAFVFVEAGTVNASAGFVCTNSTAITIGTTAINFTQFSGAGEITAGTGLSKSGNTMSLVTPISDGNLPAALAGHAITGGSIDNTPVGATTPSTGYFSALKVKIGGFFASFTHAFTADRVVTLPGDANVTLVGTDTTQTLTNKSIAASEVNSGQLALVQGGTHADLSGTGAANSFLKQSSSGADVTVGTIATADIATALASPGPVGSSTPGTGAFTSLSIGALDASAIAEFDSTTKGLLIPRMTTTQRNAISTPADGLLVYDTTLHLYYGYENGAWTAVGSGGGSGTVTSVSASVPSYESVSVSNPTTTPAIAITANNQNANIGLFGPASGSAAAPTFRAPVIADLLPLEIFYFGDGSDGALTISSGTTTLTRDMYYSSITISGTAILNTNGWKIFCSGTIDLQSGSWVITNSGTNGGNGSGTTAGAAGVSGAGNTVGGGSTVGAGGAGRASNQTTGITGIAGANVSPSNGGSGGVSAGVGGKSSSASASAAVNGGTSSNPLSVHRFMVDALLGASLLQGGCGGGGGGGGAGQATVNSGGGGGGGGGAGNIWISANVINRSGSTPSSCIKSTGGDAGTGAAASNGAAGDGGGGSGGGGGWIYISYGTLTGSTASNALDASGGAGGTSNALGSNSPVASGGDGGAGGRVTLVNINAQTVTETTGSAGTAHSGRTGGAGNSLKVAL